MSLLERFDREGSSRTYGLLRIAFALLVWVRFADQMMPLRSLVPSHLAISTVYYVGSTLMLVGWWSRVGTALTAVALCAIVFGVGGDHDHHHTRLMTYTVCILAFAETGRSLSLDRWLAGDAAPPERAPVWPLWALGVLVGTVYFWSAYDKTHRAFLSGIRLQQIHIETWWTSEWNPSAPVAALFAVSAWVTVILEYALPFVLWVRRWHWITIPAGIVLHALFYLALPVGVFSLEMASLYLAFVDPDLVHDAMDRLLPTRRAPGLIRDGSPSQ